MTESEPLYVQRTLDWCNKMRRLRGKKILKKMPRGKRSDPESCPCGRATGLSVGHNYYHDFSRSGGHKPLPQFVQNFVKAFDNGRLPQYEEKGG